MSIKTKRYLIGETAVAVLLSLIPSALLEIVGRTRILGDTVQSFIPLKSLALEELFAGRMPLWTSKVGTGIPLYADEVSLPLDPRNIFFELGDAVTAYKLMLLSSLVIGAIAAFLYFRVHWRRSFAASVVATFIFVFTTTSVSETRVDAFAIVFALFPLTVWFTELVVKKLTIWRLLGLVAVWTYLFLAGSPAILITVPVIVTTWVLVTTSKEKTSLKQLASSLLKIVTVQAVSILWAAALVAITLLPFLELTGFARRGGEYPADPYALSGVIGAVFGPLPGNPLVPAFNHFFYVSVIGLGVVLVVIWGLRKGRGSFLEKRMWWLGLGWLIFLVVMESPFKPLMSEIFPSLATVSFYRFNFVLSFITAWFVSKAIDEYGKGEFEKRPELSRISALGFKSQLIVLIVLAVLCIAYPVTVKQLYGESPSFFLVNQTFSISLLIFVLLCGGIKLAAFEDLRSGRVSGWISRYRGISRRKLLVVLICAEIAVTWLWVGDTQPDQNMYPKTPEIAYLEKNKDLNYRVIEIGLPVSENLENRHFTYPESLSASTDALAYHDITTAGLYESLVPDRLLKVFDRLEDLEIKKKAIIRAPEAVAIPFVRNDNVLDTLAVKQVIAQWKLPKPKDGIKKVLDGKAYDVYERPFARPRSYVVQDKGSVIQNSANIVEDTGRKVVITADLSSPGKLVLADLNYPGWKAQVDGKPVPIELWDGWARAIGPIKKGHHVITFVFEPAVFRQGKQISLWALGFTGVIVFMGVVVGVTRRLRRSN